jgi:hypothetical protein
MVLVAGIFLSTSAMAEKSSWQGLHLSFGKTVQSGGHDFTISHEKVGSFQVWELPLSGHGSVVEIGYRWQLGQSPVTVGPTVSVMNGSLTGSKTWRHAGTGASASLAYASEFQATAGLEIGYIVSERTLITLEGGVVASDAGLSLSAVYADYAAGTGISGYLPGTYLAAGFDHQLKNGAVLEVEIGRYSFDCVDEIGAVNGQLLTDAIVASIGVGIKF